MPQWIPNTDPFSNFTKKWNQVSIVKVICSIPLHVVFHELAVIVFLNVNLTKLMSPDKQTLTNLGVTVKTFWRCD